MYDFERLWENTRAEERFYIDQLHKSFAFYSTFLSAIFAATIAGAMRAENSFHFLLLLSGPILIVLIAEIGKGATSRYYQRFVEAISTIAKLESDLGMLDPKNRGDGEVRVWEKEPVVAKRHFSSWSEHTTSQSFIEKTQKVGYQKFTKSTFLCFQVMGILVGLALLAQSLWPTAQSPEVTALFHQTFFKLV